MRFNSLADWLAWQETLHPKSIDLGLDRIRDVYARMGLSRPAPVVITVGGTNGKGSCVACLDAMLRAAGYRVGAYTSPHLLEYNERITLDGRRVADEELVGAFDRVDRALDGVTLTYFEFGTLAAFDLMERAGMDVAVLEVGLGGRLDAVNIIDADCVLITTIGLDHMDWLGPNRESIAREKAGIMREGRPAVCGDRDPPHSLLQEAGRMGAELRLIGRDFDFDDRGESWVAVVGAPGGARSSVELPKPAMPGAYQLDNAACCLQVLACLDDRLTVPDTAVAEGLQSAVLPGRLQRIEIDGVEVILDVAHNPQAAASLASALGELQERSPQVAVFAQLAGKDHRGVVEALRHEFNHWYLAGLEGARALSGPELAHALSGLIDGDAITVCPDVAHALGPALREAGSEGRVVVFGSFRTVEEALPPSVV